LGVAGGYAITQAKLSAGVQAEPAAPTVGEFALRLASQMKLTNEVATPEQAIAALRTAGLMDREPLNLGAPLTERAVVRLTNPLKLGLTTQNPDRGFSREQTNTFFSVFAGTLRQGSGRTRGVGSLGGVQALWVASSIMNGSEPAADDDGGEGADPCGDDHGANPCERGRGKKIGLSPSDPE